VGLKTIELIPQLPASVLENLLQGIALVEHGVRDVELLAIQHIGWEQREGSEQSAVEIAAKLNVWGIVRSVAFAHVVHGQRTAKAVKRMQQHLKVCPTLSKLLKRRK
jgi:hypothetical protein